MKRNRLIAMSLFAALFSVAPALAGVDGVTIINNSGAPLRDISARRVGTDQWVPLSPGQSPGARARVDFHNMDCAFDFRAAVAGGAQLLWRGVNLCDVKSVTLNRDGAGRLWVDYD